ncbi:unnamed protein product [Prorocentrum cordatum]|uniref:NADP-dependent oxidoreductase domain-containing protein n=1 Tax=Prorocentrum cordatum TaxID=2364126 RepID=A0ABN9V718_9DINO|nr:unnamed protein product [Polarella glacialis]
MALAALALTAGSGAIPGAGLLQLGRGILDGGGALDAAGALLNVRLLRSPAAASLEATSCGQGLLALPGAGGLAGDGEGEPCMPALAFGTAGLGEGTAEAVAAALEAGFRAFDTATHPAAGEGFGYDQGALGAALSAAWTQRPRQEIFLASKVHPADFGYQGALQAVERAVEELGPAAAGHLDLVLLHWPTCEDEFCPRGGRLRPLGDFLDAWRGLEEARSRGLVRSLGVSNFDAEQLGSLLRDARVKPSVAGLWADIFHPVPRAMRRLCREQGVRLQVFGTLGYEWSQARGRRGWRAPRSSPLLDHPEVRRIARARGLTVSEVCLKFFLQQGIAVVATSRQPARAFAAGDLRSGRRLSGEDLEALRDLEGFLGSSLRPLYSPDHYAGMLGFDTQAMAPPPGAASSAAAWSCEEARPAGSAATGSHSSAACCRGRRWSRAGGPPGGCCGRTGAAQTSRTRPRVIPGGAA